jgi:acid phosphatase type 7
MTDSNVSHLRRALVCLIGLAGLAEPGHVEAATTTMAPTTGINASNTTWGSDNGSSCTGAMWSCVDDGTTFAANDGNHTYVYSQAANGYHTTGYASVSGTVSQVVVHTVAAAMSGASGNATVSLYVSGTLQATKNPHALTTTYTEYVDTFTGLSIPSTGSIQVRVTFSAMNLKYTSVWVDATTGSPADPVLAGAGDIACNAALRACTTKCGTSCCDCKDGATYNQLVSINPTYVFTLGDNQYENGDYANYSDTLDGYASTWGQKIGITFPAVGNHEYNGNASCTACGCTPGCCSETCCDTVAKRYCARKAYLNANYYQYFSSVKAAEDPNGDGWYSYDVQTSDPSRPWHVIVLNSSICNTTRFPSWASAANCQSGSPQYTWLTQDLASWAASGKKCLMAYWHEPRFSSGTGNGGSANYAQLWSLLQSYGVDVILQGHDHHYERFNPQNSSGAADPTGPIGFIVGTGGRDSDTCRTPRAANSARCEHDTFGVLKLTLHSNSWDYEFQSVAGTPVTDVGLGIDCHN